MTKVFVLMLMGLLLIKARSNPAPHNSNNTKVNKTIGVKISPKTSISKSNKTDTLLVLFGNAAYSVHLVIFDENSYDETKPNATLSFIHNKKIIFKDSLYCMWPETWFEDFNNDGIKDLAIAYYTGARANPTYHLYLINNTLRTLTRVKGFEKIPNPSLIAATNIITGSALWGDSETCTFYRIKKNKLINLDYSFDAKVSSDADDLKHERAYKMIIKKWGRK